MIGLIVIELVAVSLYTVSDYSIITHLERHEYITVEVFIVRFVRVAQNMVMPNIRFVAFCGGTLIRYD